MRKRINRLMAKNAKQVARSPLNKTASLYRENSLRVFNGLMVTCLGYLTDDV
jgi:hypothetical protein